jgi:hypothetical protein
MNIDGIAGTRIEMALASKKLGTMRDNSCRENAGECRAASKKEGISAISVPWAKR